MTIYDYEKNYKDLNSKRINQIVSLCFAARAQNKIYNLIYKNRLKFLNNEEYIENFDFENIIKDCERSEFIKYMKPPVGKCHTITNDIIIRTKIIYYNECCFYWLQKKYQKVCDIIETNILHKEKNEIDKITNWISEKEKGNLSSNMLLYYSFYFLCKTQLQKYDEKVKLFEFYELFYKTAFPKIEKKEKERYLKTLNLRPWRFMFFLPMHIVYLKHKSKKVKINDYDKYVKNLKEKKLIPELSFGYFLYEFAQKQNNYQKTLQSNEKFSNSNELKSEHTNELLKNKDLEIVGTNILTKNS